MTITVLLYLLAVLLSVLGIGAVLEVRAARRRSHEAIMRRLRAVTREYREPGDAA